MKKIIGAAFVAVLLLSGCTAVAKPVASESTVADVTNDFSSNVGSSDEELFLQVIQDSAPALFDATTNEKLLGIGNAICDSLDAGATFDEILNVAFEAGLTGKNAGALVAASVIGLCPEYTDEMRDFVG